MKANTKEELTLSLKNNDETIIINDDKIINKLKLLANINIKQSDKNRCNYTLNNQIDSIAFLGVFGFTPMISDICNISIVNSIGLISTIGLSEILTILSKYNIKYKDKKIILSILK